MMVFPQTPAPLVSEMLINGAWTEVTADRLIESGLTISRGRRDWASRVVASRCDQALLNPTGLYSNRNPLSVNFGLLGRGAQLRHRLRWVQDTFGGSTSGGWGTSNTGQTWASSGGTIATDYAETGGFGTHTLTTVSTARNSILTTPVDPFDVVATIKVSAVATGDIIYAGPCLSADGTSNNLYQARLQMRTDSTVWLEVIKRVAGVQTTIVAAVNVGNYVPDFRYVVRLQRTAWGLIRAGAVKRFPTPTQTVWTSAVVDTDLTSFTAIICRSQTGTANTNVNPVVSWDEVEVNDFRFWGETTTTAPAWDKSGKKVTQPFQANGILQRLSSGNPPKLSPVRRTITGAAPFAYWPMEDGAGTTQFASALPGQPPAQAGITFSAPGIGGTVPHPVAAAADDTMPGSLPVARLDADINGGSSIAIRVPQYIDTSGRWAVQIPIHPTTINTAPQIWITFRNGGGAFLFLEFTLPAFNVSADAPDGTQLFSVTDSNAGLPGLVGGWLLWEISGTSAGAWKSRLWNTSGQIVASVTASSAAAYSQPALIELNNFSQPAISSYGVGHVTLITDASYDTTNGAQSTAKAMGGWVGETAAARMQRVCAEAGIPFSLMDASDQTSQVGVQPIDTLPEVLFRAAEADQGILYEPRDALGFAYRPRTTLYDQTGLSLSYAPGYITDPFLPTEDDQTLLNDVTAQRDGGSFARVVITGGALGTTAAGTHPEQQTWNVAGDDQLAGIAGWRAHLGTWDEARYPALTVSMANPAMTTSLIGQVSRTDIGDVVTVTGLPVWLPPDAVDLLVEGTTEFFGDGKDWTQTLLCVPAGPYDVREYDTDDSDTNPLGGRYSSDVLELVASVGSNDGTLPIFSDPPFTENPLHFNQNARLGGEVVTVSAVAPTLLDNYGRTLVDSWGTTTDGQTYTLVGTAANFDVNGSMGTIAPGATGSDRIAYVVMEDDGSRRLATLRVQFDALPASGNLRAGLMMRYQDANNFLAVVAQVDSAGAVSVVAYERVAGTLTAVATVVNGITLLTATSYTLTAEVTATGAIRAKAWKTSLTEPTHWDLIGSNSSILTGSGFGAYGRDASAAITHTFSYDALRLLSPQLWTVTRSANGVVKGHSLSSGPLETTVTLESAAIYVP